MVEFYQEIAAGAVRSAAVYPKPRAQVLLFRANHLRSRAENRAGRIPLSLGHLDELKMEQTGSDPAAPVVFAAALNELPLKVESWPPSCRATGATIGTGSGSFRSIS
jgi:hypothetical protein